MSAHGESKGIPFVTPIQVFLDREDIDPGVVVAIIGFVIIVIAIIYSGVPQSKIVTFAFLTAPIWLPYITFHMFFEKWLEMVGQKFLVKGGREIYEIKLPPEVFKSPEAMEFIFTQIYNAASPDNLMETYIDGKRPIFYSAEIVSRGGDIHFYMTLSTKFMQAIANNFYSQYPGVEILKLDLDYTAEIPLDLKGISFMSFLFNKQEDEEFPIKTYIDFGMDKLPKEEFKVDPMTPMLEMLAAIRPEQQVWIQFLFKAHRKKEFKHGQLHKKSTWEKRVYAKVDEIMKRGDFAPKKEEGVSIDMGAARLTTFEKDTIDAMTRNAGKFAFEFVARVVYISHKEGDYDGGLYSRFIRSFTQTTIKGRNGLGIYWRTDFNYNFISDPFGKRRDMLKKHEIHLYKTRNHHGSTKVLSAEELATIFHLPGTVAATPTLNRVASTRGEAPSNLPTGVLPH